jgi:hypothetical protein
LTICRSSCINLVYLSVMRYAFVFLSIFAVWFSVILLAIESDVNGLFLALVALFMTLSLFLIGFQRGS